MYIVAAGYNNNKEAQLFQEKMCYSLHTVPVAVLTSRSCKDFLSHLKRQDMASFALKKCTFLPLSIQPQI